METLSVIYWTQKIANDWDDFGRLDKIDFYPEDQDDCESPEAINRMETFHTRQRWPKRSKSIPESISLSQNSFLDHTLSLFQVITWKPYSHPDCPSHLNSASFLNWDVRDDPDG